MFFVVYSLGLTYLYNYCGASMAYGVSSARDCRSTKSSTTSMSPRFRMSKARQKWDAALAARKTLANKPGQGISAAGRHWCRGATATLPITLIDHRSQVLFAPANAYGSALLTAAAASVLGCFLESPDAVRIYRHHAHNKRELRERDEPEATNAEGRRAAEGWLAPLALPALFEDARAGHRARGHAAGDGGT